MPLWFRTWNVQHGSAAYIRTPNGKHIVVDLGAESGDSGGFSPLSYLKDQETSQLDLVVISHPHLDHIEDILNFDQLNPRYLIRPKHLTDDDVWAKNRDADEWVKQIIRKYIELNDEYKTCSSPQDDPRSPENNGGVSIKTFIPKQSPHTNLNNHSVVTVISYAGVKILIPGDNEPPSWDELLEQSDFKEAISDVNILVAPHHGRESGFHSDLFNHFKPFVTIISDGPSLDTSATSRYSKVTEGWWVDRRNGPSQFKKCVTTRNDGIVDVTINEDIHGQSFSVQID